MKNIECEIRSFITKDQYRKLMRFFKKEATFLGEDDQITYYFDAKQDLRIQQNNNFSKIWLKKGKIHDERREEIEIKCAREDFKKLEELFLTLGYRVEIKWFRERHTFRWDGIDVMLDYTRGYGYIIELEKISSKKDEKTTLNYLKEKMREIGVPLTPKEEFERNYQYYKNNWKKLLGTR